MYPLSKNKHATRKCLLMSTIQYLKNPFYPNHYSNNQEHCERLLEIIKYKMYFT